MTTCLLCAGWRLRAELSDYYFEEENSFEGQPEKSLQSRKVVDVGNCNEGESGTGDAGSGGDMIPATGHHMLVYIVGRLQMFSRRWERKSHWNSRKKYFHHDRSTVYDLFRRSQGQVFQQDYGQHETVRKTQQQRSSKGFQHGLQRGVTSLLKLLFYLLYMFHSFNYASFVEKEHRPHENCQQNKEDGCLCLEKGGLGGEGGVKQEGKGGETDEDGSSQNCFEGEKEEEDGGQHSQNQGCQSNIEQTLEVAPDQVFGQDFFSKSSFFHDLILFCRPADSSHFRVYFFLQGRSQDRVVLRVGHCEQIVGSGAIPNAAIIYCREGQVNVEVGKGVGVVQGAGVAP